MIWLLPYTVRKFVYIYNKFGCLPHLDLLSEYQFLGGLSLCQVNLNYWQPIWFVSLIASGYLTYRKPFFFSWFLYPEICDQYNRLQGAPCEIRFMGTSQLETCRAWVTRFDGKLLGWWLSQVKIGYEKDINWINLLYDLFRINSEDKLIQLGVIHLLHANKMHWNYFFKTLLDMMILSLKNQFSCIPASSFLSIILLCSTGWQGLNWSRLIPIMLSTALWWKVPGYTLHQSSCNSDIHSIWSVYWL